MKAHLLGVNPVAMEGQIQRKPYMPDKYTIDDYDADPDLPFYEINLTPEIREVGDELIEILIEVLEV